MGIEEAIAVAKTSRWLSLQPKPFQNALCERMRLVEIERNQSLFHFDDRAQDTFCLVGGSALISIVHPVQGMIHAHVMLPPRWFGEPAALGARPRIMSVQARQTCALLAISRSAVDSLLKDHPEFCWNFYNLMAFNVEDYMLHTIDLLIADPRLRTYSRLLTFAGRLLHHLPQAPVTIPLSQEEFALATNLSRSTVHPWLMDLVARGICALGYREIRILDMEGLAALLDDSKPARGNTA